MRTIDLREILRNLKFFKRDTKLVIRLGKELEAEVGSFLQFESSASGLNVVGKLADVSELPATGNVGDAYVIQNYLYTWTGDEYENLGALGGTVVIQGTVATYADLPDDLDIEDSGTAYLVEGDGQLYVWGGLSWPDQGTGMIYQGPEGPIGESGFSPHLTVEADGERRVLKIIDWIGPGQEVDKPNTSIYLGDNGEYVTDIAQAADFRDVSSLEAFVDKAEQWADSPEDTEVAPGQYSSKHHAAKSQASALESQSSATASATSETNAASSASASASSASAAALSETSASDSEAAAALSETNAATSESNAASSASAALSSENKSEQWADANEDIAVEPGKYSAKHHAIKAESSATAASISETNAALSETNASDSEAAAGLSETAAALSETNAGLSASAASTSETNASNSESAAALSETNAANSETAAATSASNASTSESNASDSETAAALSATAASTSETNAASSETAAALSETNASDSETAAALSESNAASSETNASNSESNALTSETNAATSETNASNSETKAEQWAEKPEDIEVEVGKYSAMHHALKAAVSDANAALSASSADTSRSQAESARDQTLSIFDQFGDTYLGPKASDPATDNDGDPLTIGDIYFNTTEEILKFYSGAAWVSPEKISTEAAQDAETSATNAATSETNAANSASSALTSETKAEEWAEKGVDLEVELNKYSAKHHATKASESEVAAALSETNAATSESNAATSESNASTSASAAATSESNAANSETNAGLSETNAALSETNAANSETAAALSETNAATSETNAANSESASLASENKANEWAEKAENIEVETGQYSALHHATKAGNSAANASTSETNAGTSETNASNSASAAALSETNAANSASAASTSETNAGTSATNAANSASAASTSETNAGLSETNAALSETNAANSEAAAALSETNAANSASAASTSETNAGTSETNAAASASAASISESNAATSETNAANSESASLASENKANEWAEKAVDLEVEIGQYSALHHASKAATSESNASTSETNAATSETNASNSASAASNSASAASTSASNASTSETNAGTSATNAANSASAASTSETNAGLSETAAALSESNAATSASNADTSASAANTARINSEAARDASISAKDQSISARNASQAAQVLSESARDDSQLAQSLSETARDGSVTAKNSSETARDLSQKWANELEDILVDGSGYSSLHYSAKSEASALASASSASDAATSEVNAATSESNAASSETNASTSESNAALSETNASSSETKAQEWAEKAVDLEVEVGQYSALHHATKASDSASSASASATTALGYRDQAETFKIDAEAAAGLSIQGIKVINRLNSIAEYPVSPSAGDAYVIDSAGNDSIHLYTGSEWTIFSVGTGTSWGEIVGTITDQTDLSSALNDKVDKIAGKGLSTEDYTTTEKSKLASIEWNATEDQTGAEIKSLYEAELDTNAYTDNEKTKLLGIETGAEVNTVDSVAGKTGIVTLTKSDVGLGNVLNVAQYSQTEVDNFFSGITGIIGYNKSNWDTAFGWGDHGTAGYALNSALTSHTNTSTIHFTQGEISIPLGQLSNVSLATLADKHVIAYNSATLDFENRLLVEADISDLQNYALVGHTHSASNITSGTFANARISQSSVTQHQGALSITESQISDLTHYTDEQVRDVVGTALVAGTNIGIAVDDVANTITLSVAGTLDNFYLDGLSFNTTNGVLTASVFDSTDQTVDLDGRYSLLGHGHSIADITNLQTELNGKEPTFTKNTAFNKSFGTVAGSVAEGNDGRILNGQTAFNWGDHALAGYAADSDLTTHTSDTTIHFTQAEISIPVGQLSNVATSTLQDDHALLYNSTAGEFQNRVLVESDISDLTTYTAGAGLTKTGSEFSITDEIFTSALKNKLDAIEAGATADQSASEIKTLYESNSNTNAYTDGEKSKLASLETSKFLGTYVSLGALTTAHPSPAEGAYAHVDAGVGVEVEFYIWDNNDSQYVLQLGESTEETAASIKTKYESNPDTNAYTDSEKTKLSGIETGAQVNVGDVFDSSGTYAGLRAQATTKVDVGLSNVLNVAQYSQTQINNFFSESTAITGYNKSNWDTAFGWGDHSGAGYAANSALTSHTGDTSIHFTQAAISIPIGQLSNVTTSAFADKQAIIYDGAGGVFENRLLTEADISDLQSYSLTGHGHSISDITNLQTELNGKEPVFTKNSGFNKNFGTTAGTVAQGNDSRIVNGQTAFGWGDHGLAGYALSSTLSSHSGDSTIHFTQAEISIPVGQLNNVTTGTLSNQHALLYNSVNSRFENRLITEADVSDLQSYALTGHTHSTADITTGTFANARIAQSNVTQHQTALSIAWSQLTAVPTYDNYVSWNLKTNGVQRTTVGSGADLDLVAGTNVSLSYGAGGVVTINSSFTNTTYSAGAGITLSGTTFSLTEDSFNSAGTYAGLRAQATTKADVGLASVDDYSRADYDVRYLQAATRNTITSASSTTEALLDLDASSDAGAGSALLSGSMASSASDRYFMTFKGTGDTINWQVSTDGILRQGTVPSERIIGLTPTDVGLGNVDNVQQVAKAGDTMTGALTVTSSVAGETVLDIQGTSGQLFSVTDSLIGTLFSVNDISGIPILDVHSDNIIKMGTFGDEALIVNGNTATASQNFKVKNALISNQENLTVDSGSAQIVATVSTTDYEAVFFDYVIKNGTAMRAGILTVVYNGTSVEFAETSTTDLGDTSPVVLTADESGGNLRLIANTSTNGWEIKTLIRGL